MASELLRAIVFRVAVGFVCTLLASTPGAQSQDTDTARKKCVEFGFQEKTTAHESCVKQFLQSMGGGAPAKPAASSKVKGATSAAPALTDAQQEERYWEDAKAVGNKEAFEAYLDLYPKGRYAGLARATVVRFNGSAIAQQGSVGSAQKRPVAEAAKLSPGQLVKDCADCPEMVMIPAGSFEMGSSESKDEKPVRRVNLGAFLLGRTEVTQVQWQAVMGSSPSYFKQCGADCPIENISWNDAQEFARKLTEKTGKNYRLPSESEWEYAARAGNPGNWSFGDDQWQLKEYAWFSTYSGAMTHPVAQKRPNAFGLFDMHGNAWEWVQDVYHENYQGAPADGSAWVSGDQALRVLRGGAWISFSGSLRSASRSQFAPDYRDYGTGLRIARAL
jgi:formylglycine-generating enzyme required for sulfatase activity